MNSPTERNTPRNRFKAGECPRNAPVTRRGGCMRPCSICKHNPPVKGMRCCWFCLRELKRLRESRAAQGLCSRCGNAPHDPGARTCASCQGQSRNRRAVRANDGLCPKCFTEPLATGKTRCGKCADRDRNKRAANRAAGLCRCGRARDGRWKSCAECRALVRARTDRRITCHTQTVGSEPDNFVTA